VTAGPAGGAARALALARLGGALRAEGVPTSLRDELDAADVLPLVDQQDRDETRAALRIALKIPRAAFATFDRLYATVWLGEGATRPPLPTPGRAAPAPARALAWNPVSRSMAGQPEEGPQPADDGNPAWSPAAVLRRKAFDEALWSPQELAEMEEILARLARRLAARRSRRWIASAALARGRVDPRRSFRRALGTAGEVVRFARRARALDEPRLVFLCDTSGSMDAHARFLLAFVLSLRRAVRRAELFVFNTELTRLTPSVAPGKIRLSLDRIAGAVPDWSGGTRLGACLAAFAADHLPRLVDARTTVVILSDGLDRGEPEVLAAALRDIRRRARRIVWLNPLLGDPRYEPLARGMTAALPFIDHLAPAHNLESLERALLHLGAWA
jgi:uncharacterized protein with von Willebrand factor type A (vWA) domain